MPDQPWTSAPMSVIDLEGTGAQDRDNEAILEIAVVPLVGGSPDSAAGWETLINPGRPIPRKPWISPGLTDDGLGDAPTPAEIAPTLATMADGRYLVGHNVGVDWRLLHRRHPDVQPAGLIDTMRLARKTEGKAPKSLGALVDRYGLRDRITDLVPDGRPHRAMWDTVAAGLLLPVLVAELWENPPTIKALLDTAGLPLGNEPVGFEQPPLL
ncbi:3'-5' exonuclease [Nocardiopsis mangrovi]|uniref:3'-5' exonuclease n=1 Tax=Nocardiopsis mangrovi TaxID=1179818 RepID=A0ABV9DUJ5_9ACTN